MTLTIIEEVNALLRELGRESEAIEDGDSVVLRTPLGLTVPDELRARVEELIAKEIKPDLDAGAFTLGPPLAYELRIPRAELSSDAVRDAVATSEMWVVTWKDAFKRALTPRPKVAPASTPSKPVPLTAGELARLKAACAAEWRPFLHRTEGALSCHERAQKWWRRHRILDVQSPMPMPAVGIPVAIGPDGELRVLRGHLEHLVAMARVDPPLGLSDAEEARAYANICDGMTTDAQWGELQVASFDEIPFRKSLTSDESEVVTRLRMRHAADMHAPRLEQVGRAFVLRKWVVSMSRLIYRELRVPMDGQLERHDKVLGDPIPVPAGKAWARDGDRFIPVM